MSEPDYDALSPTIEGELSPAKECMLLLVDEC